MYFSDNESSGCANETEILKDDELQTEGFMKHTRNRFSLSPFTSSRQKSSSSDNSLVSSSPMSNYLSEDSKATSTSPFSLYKLDSDDSEKSCTSSKKRKTCETSTYPSREGPRSGLKNIMQNFTNQIIESQQKLLVKTIGKNNVSLIKKCSINIIISFYSKRKCYSQGCRI